MNATNSTDPFVFNGKIDRTPTVLPKVLFTTVKIEDSDYKNDLNGKYFETVAFAKNQPVYNELKDYEEGNSIRARGRIEHKTYQGKDVIQLVLTSLNPSVPNKTTNDDRDYATLQDLGLDSTNESEPITRSNGPVNRSEWDDWSVLMNVEKEYNGDTEEIESECICCDKPMSQCDNNFNEQKHGPGICFDGEDDGTKCPTCNGSDEPVVDVV